MGNSFLKSNYKSELKLLFVLCTFDVILLAVRVLLSNSYFYLFLAWNLFLASIPWVISTIFMMKKKVQSRKIVLLLLFTIWLLFLPNAPYIITDLFHLKNYSSMPTWFDLTLILMYAWTGLTFGYLSLKHVEYIIDGYISERLRQIILIPVFFLCSFGIYIGRYLRWNSWDVIQNPMLLMGDISDRLLNPIAHKETWAVTFTIGTFLFLMYWTVNYFNQNRMTFLQSNN